MATFSEYDTHDALALAELVQKGEATAEQLLDTALDIAGRLNPQLNAIVLDHAAQARGALAAGLAQGPLRGVPFLVKDLHAKLAGTRTTNGCKLFADDVADHDSELVRRYRQAGLVIFGKTHSSELGFSPSSESAMFGVTQNPWRAGHSAGGSSGGSAAAVAAGIVPCAHASDGGGSIRIPAACCGVYGLKPTRARTPLGPDELEAWAGLGVMHAVSRSVRDSAALLDATAGMELGAPYAAPAPTQPYLGTLDTPPGRLRIALQTETFNGTPTHPDCEAAALHAAKLCESLGHHVEQARVPVDPLELRQVTGSVITVQIRNTLQARAAALGRPLRQEDVEPGTWLAAEMGRMASAPDYAGAVEALHRIGRQVAIFLTRYDAILTPTMGTPPLPHGRLSLQIPDVNAYMNDVSQTIGYCQLYNVSGHPAASLPLYWNADGLPIGVQLATRFGDETTLLRLSRQLEQAQPWFERRPPTRA